MLLQLFPVNPLHLSSRYCTLKIENKVKSEQRTYTDLNEKSEDTKEVNEKDKMPVKDKQ
jgi:hypothetical protein